MDYGYSAAWGCFRPGCGTIPRHLEGIRICFDAQSSLLAGACVYGVAAYALRRDNPRLKWGGVALMGITAMWALSAVGF